MASILHSDDSMPHLKAAQGLTKLVSLQNSVSALPDLGGADGLLGDEFGAVTPALPLTRFGSVNDVERIANDLELAIGSGSIRTHEEMYGVFYELALNAVQHSESAVGCYAMVEQGVDADGRTLHLLGVADCGIGIRAALIRNPDFAYLNDDADAVRVQSNRAVAGRIVQCLGHRSGRRPGNQHGFAGLCGQVNCSHTFTSSIIPTESLLLRCR